MGNSDGPLNSQKMQRYVLTNEEMRERWIDWRCKRQMEIALRARDELRKYREDLSCLMVNCLSVQRIDQWASEQDLSYHETNRLHGFGSTLYKEHDGLWYGAICTPLIIAGHQRISGRIGSHLRWQTTMIAMSIGLWV